MFSFIPRDAVSSLSGPNMTQFTDTLKLISLYPAALALSVIFNKKRPNSEMQSKKVTHLFDSHSRGVMIFLYSVLFA